MQYLKTDWRKQDENWLDNVVALNVKANSMQVYTFIANKHIFS